MSDWGQGAKNNNIGWGQGAVNNDISWGLSHSLSYSGDTDIVGARPLLLDLYPNAAAAYSLRRLNSDYTGDAIRVRRASDNTEQNIGFVNNELDTASLTTFCSGTDGFVTTWYDQSVDGRNTTQSIASKQPKIYDSVTGVILENGKPAIDFDGVDDYLFNINGFGTTEYTGFHVFNIKSDIANQRVIHIKNNSLNTHMIRLSSLGYYPRTLTDDIDYNSPFESFIINETNLTSFYNKDTMYFNNFLVLNKSASTTGVQGNDGIYLGCRADLSNFGNLKIIETISYAIDRNSDISEINTNINNYYNIY